ncbi:GGDEF domain-containing protein [Phytoactinopolyspora limicola]|uniref:GGDEF domain-containing protein n=1 Tax=Phytoactinopolyspora limicola TaxID=2715536 RepID=UPI00140A17A0|nr:GGDEF domain-containing protein [Phytoactinopolyspora limicola]
MQLTRWVQGWALWRLPRPVLVLVLTVEALAVGVASATAALVEITTDDLARFSALIVSAWLAIELTRQAERRRASARPSAHTAYFDATTTWSIAAIIILPPALATVTVVTIHLLLWFRVKLRQAVPYRWVYSGAAALLATQVAVLVLAASVPHYPGLPDVTSGRGLLALGAIILAGALRWAIDVGLVMLAIALFTPTQQIRKLFAGFCDNLLEAAGVGLGLVAAALLVHYPAALPGLVIAMIVVQRSLMVSYYEHAARIDTKTGLTSAGRWHEFATDMLTRSRHQRTNIGLLMLDLDHFKIINDTHGHVFGDEVLRAVANELRAEIRDEDACGRWGGEEFSIVLSDLDSSQDLSRVADRLRLRIQSIVMKPPNGSGESIRISTSVGGVYYQPNNEDDTITLDDLTVTADAALYAAKHAGRNTIRITTLEGQTQDDSTPTTPNRPTPESTQQPGRTKRLGQ